MGAKKRFKKRDIEVKSLEQKEQAKLKLVKGNSININQPLMDLSSFENLKGKENYLENKLHCYHKINELFQNNSLSMFHLVKGVLEIICFGVDAEGGSAWIIEEDKIVCKVANGPGSEKIIGHSLNLGEGIVGWVAENRKSQIVYDTSIDQRFKNKKDKKDLTKTLIATPLIYNNEVIGVIEVVNKKTASEKYTDSDKSFLEDLSTLIAMYIKINRSLKEQEKHISRMSNFSQLHEKFSSTIELDKLLVIVLERAIKLLNAEVGSIWLVEESGDGIECSYAVGDTKDKVQGLKLKRGVGIVGQVIDDQKGKIVEDCRKDKNFSKLVDDKVNFITRSMVCSPFVVKGECIGAIQIVNKKGSQLFDEDDFDLLNLFGSSASMYLKNARLHQSEKKAKDLSALIEIGKHITSTLDLDAVLCSIVNLSSKLIAFDESHISVKKPGGSESVSLRAISGQQEVEINEKNKQTEEIHNFMIKKEIDELNISSLAKFDEKKDPIIIKKYLEENELESFWAHVLKDDQGHVGVLSIESEHSDLVKSETNEILEILTSQSTVSLRNVDLYNTIPSSQFVKNIKDNLIHKVYNLKDVSKDTWKKLGFSVLAIILFLSLVKIPHNISANIEILPKQLTYFSQVQSTVKRIYVKEGTVVKKGDLLFELDTQDSKIQLYDKQSKLQKAKAEMFKHLGERNIGDYKIKESEYISLDYEIELLQKKIDRSKVFATQDGVIISENLQELVGKPVNFGEEIIKLASKDLVVAKFEVPEDYVQYVKPNQEIKFKVYGMPNNSFSNGLKLVSVAGEGRQVLESDPNKYYMAKAQVEVNQFDEKLRPGMTGRGKIYGEWQPVGHVLFSKIYNFLAMEVFF